jgi:general L-amino acid transport system substrate-binding protein
MVKQTGNYQQIFDRNLGRQSPTQMVRGPNRVWRDGGLLLTPLLR